MGIEVVHYKDDFFGIWVHDIYEVLDLLCSVKGCAVLMDTGMVSASKWLDKRKDAAGAIPHIFGIQLLDVDRTHRQSFPGIAQ